jgi:hypothetical protein
MQRTHAFLLVHAFAFVNAPTLHVGSNNTTLCSILAPTHATFSYNLARMDKNLPRKQRLRTYGVYEPTTVYRVATKRKIERRRRGTINRGTVGQRFLKTKLKIFKSQKSKGKYFEDADLMPITCVKLKTKN